MDDRQYQYAEQPQTGDIIDPFAAEHPVNNEPFVRYCRNCGEKVEPGASVCVHCNYVLDVATLQRAQRMQRVRYEQAQRQAKRNRGLLGVISDTLTRVLVGEQPTKNGFTENPRRQNYLYHTVGACYCSACGTEVEAGAVACVHCGYIIDRAAYQKTQLMVADRNAELTTADILKSLFIPFYGKRMYKTYALRRPQVAEPCRKLGYVNAGLIAAVIALIVLLLLF